MKYLLLALITLPVFISAPTISLADNTMSIFTRYQMMDFDNSAQKIKGERYGLRLDVNGGRNVFNWITRKQIRRLFSPQILLI